jgi:AcrR family transcriptional regulator
MHQGERSERSQTQILNVALELFSHQGYRATSIRDIAAAAGVSTGNVYHHFPDKETIFRTLLDQYWAAIDDPDFPFNRALASSSFPDNLEEAAHAARDSVAKFRRYVALIYVDVVEFDGSHIRKFYSEMAERFARFMEQHSAELAFTGRLREGVSPLTAVMLASRFFLHYYATEILFGVPNQFGRDSEQVVREVADIMRHGMLRRDPGPTAR